eukprot:CAMPEP_0181310916 /NCGR_PEP_ID=MMETSP1101-20121128/12851_1 /TAXON_ID=46948 /ORGANISM="Rhodomonas abbreviata, Strain Caron Lab Isolate" /LENGTH=75 /DNA_ID=CAMNT_0023417597 /DNA_START=21 /DNA_END=248 /DNA_ORIENTATION=-
MFLTLQQKSDSKDASESVQEAVGKVTTTMLFNNGINYDPFNPMGNYGSGKKDRKAASKVTSLVTKVRNETMFRPW